MESFFQIIAASPAIMMKQMRGRFCSVILLIFLLPLLDLPATTSPQSTGARPDNLSDFKRPFAGRPRLRDLGLTVGVLRIGRMNAITDVAGVRVGHCTLHDQQRGIHTGVTAIIPHPGNVFQEKVPGAVYVGNGFGKLIGSTQINELGTIETPILLTNTLSVWTAAEALVRHLLQMPGNEKVSSINPVVGETNDGTLNDIRSQHIRAEHMLAALQNAGDGPVVEGSVGAGAGTICFGFKGGIGSSSRLLPSRGVGPAPVPDKHLDTGRSATVQPGYTVGALVQTNYGGILEIAGIPVGRELQAAQLQKRFNGDGSCMMVVATDAPLTYAALMRLAKRAMLAIGRTGSSSSHGSGDYVIAFSTSEKVRVPRSPRSATLKSYGSGAEATLGFDGCGAEPPRRDDHPQRTSHYEEVNSEILSLLFQAAMEATEEAIYNSLLQATAVTGIDGRTIEALPLEQLRDLIKKYRP